MSSFRVVGLRAESAASSVIRCARAPVPHLSSPAFVGMPLISRFAHKRRLRVDGGNNRAQEPSEKRLEKILNENALISQIPLALKVAFA
mmetsp:Transcript_31962/g.43273  ORF Transcript_31962/g.43273 Transcript_31962/m.43273 type:complete len:89 (-) Transcript_31962:51-317(-)